MTHRQVESPLRVRIDATLGQMRDLCTQIDQIGLEQQQMLDSDRFEDFVELLIGRNPKIQSLTRAGALVEQMLEEDGLGVDQVRSARNQLDEMSLAIEAILKRDAEQQLVVEERRDALSKKLSGVGASQTALRAYGGGSRSPNPTLQDREV